MTRLEELKKTFEDYIASSLEQETSFQTSKNVYKHSRATNYIAFGLQRYYRLLSNIPGGYIAGGVFKNLFKKQPVRDLDIFFESEKAFKNATTYYTNNPKYTFHYENENCEAYRHLTSNRVIELVKKRFLPVEDMLDMFDFTVAKAALKLEEDGQVVFTYHEDFFEHLITNKLVIVNEPLLPVNTLQRSWKYASYGFGLCRESKAMLTKAVIEKGNVEDLNRELYFGLD
jgi:hypothetical protein